MYFINNEAFCFLSFLLLWFCWGEKYCSLWFGKASHMETFCIYFRQMARSITNREPVYVNFSSCISMSLFKLLVFSLFSFSLWEIHPLPHQTPQQEQASARQNCLVPTSHFQICTVWAHLITLHGPWAVSPTPSMASMAH